MTHQVADETWPDTYRLQDRVEFQDMPHAVGQHHRWPGPAPVLTTEAHLQNKNEAKLQALDVTSWATHVQDTNEVFRLNKQLRLHLCVDRSVFEPC